MRRYAKPDSLLKFGTLFRTGAARSSSLFCIDVRLCWERAGSDAVAQVLVVGEMFEPQGREDLGLRRVGHCDVIQGLIVGATLVEVTGFQ